MTVSQRDHRRRVRLNLVLLTLRQRRAAVSYHRAANDDVAGTKYDPKSGLPVIGRRWDTAVAKEWQGHHVIDLRANPNANQAWEEAYLRGDKRPDGNPVTAPGWSPELNEDWIDSIIENRAPVYLGSNPEGGSLWNKDLNQPSVFADEVNRLKSRGYQHIDDYLVPEELSDRWRASTADQPTQPDRPASGEFKPRDTYDYNIDPQRRGPLDQIELRNDPRKRFVSDTFSGGQYNEFTATEDMYIYQVGDEEKGKHGVGNPKLGSFFSFEPPRSQWEARRDFAIRQNLGRSIDGQCDAFGGQPLVQGQDCQGDKTLLRPAELSRSNRHWRSRQAAGVRSVDRCPVEGKHRLQVAAVTLQAVSEN